MRNIISEREGFEQKTILVPLWKRAFAYLIDLIIVFFVVFLPIGNLFFEDSRQHFDGILSPIGAYSGFSFGIFLLSFLTALLSVLYWAILEYKVRQSVGKMAMGIKVIDAFGMKLRFSQGFLRNLSKISTFLLFFDVLYGVIKKDNVRFFEVLSNTRVVNTNGKF